MYTIGVKFFGNNKIYEFKSKTKYSNDDMVICDTQYGFVIAKVIGVRNGLTNNAKKWVIRKVNINKTRCNKILQSLNSKRID